MFPKYKEWLDSEFLKGRSVEEYLGLERNACMDELSNKEFNTSSNGRIDLIGSHYIYDINILSRLKNFQAKLKAEKGKIRQESRKIQALKKEITDLSEELAREGCIKDAYSVLEFMDGINERYEMDPNCETAFSRLYYDITEDYVRCEILDDREDEEEKSYEEFLGECDEAEREYILCKLLLDKVRFAKFEYKMLREKLKSIKREHMGLTQVDRNGNIDDSRLDDFCY